MAEENKNNVHEHENTKIATNEEVEETKHTLLEELQEKTEKDKENKPSVIEKLHGSTEEVEKTGVIDQIKEKLPGHSKKPEDSPVVNTKPLVETATPITTEEHPEEKKGIMEKIKEKLPGNQAKTTGEEEKKEKV